MTPALIILLGIEAPIAVGTSLVVIFVNSSFGIFKRRGSGTVDIKLATIISCGSIAGIFVGLRIMEWLKAMPPLMILGKELSSVQYILLCLFLLLMGGMAGFLIFDLKRNRGKTLEKRFGLFAKIKTAPYGHFNSLEEPKISIPPIVLLGFAVGLLTSLMGVGGGVVMVPALIYLVGQRTIKAAGTSLALVWIASLLASAGHIAEGNIKLLLLTAMVVGGIIGTLCGTNIGLKLAGRKIRTYFIYILILAILMVAGKLYCITFM